MPVRTETLLPFFFQRFSHKSIDDVAFSLRRQQLRKTSWVLQHPCAHGGGTSVTWPASVVYRSPTNRLHQWVLSWSPTMGTSSPGDWSGNRGADGCTSPVPLREESGVTGQCEEGDGDERRQCPLFLEHGTLGAARSHFNTDPCISSRRMYWSSVAECRCPSSGSRQVACAVRRHLLRHGSVTRSDAQLRRTGNEPHIVKNRRKSIPHSLDTFLAGDPLRNFHAVSIVLVVNFIASDVVPKTSKCYARHIFATPYSCYVLSTCGLCMTSTRCGHEKV